MRQPIGKGSGIGHPAVMSTVPDKRWLQLTGTEVGTMLDTCAGSGTALRAAREAGCRRVWSEINPAFVDLIEGRLTL